MNSRFSSYFSLFSVFFKIGAFTFGGGWAMLSIIEKEIVEKRNWLSQEEFLNAVALSQTIPGIMAVNISIYTGRKRHQFLGALCAALGTILPSFFIILLFALFFSQVAHEPHVVSVFRAVRPAVVALILIPVLSSSKSLGIKGVKILLPLSVVLSISVFDVSPVYVIVSLILLALMKKVYVDYKKGGKV